MRMPTNAPASALAFGIASALADVKRARGLSGQQIADLTGLSQAQISRWINAKVDILAVDLVVLCQGLGVDPRDFLETATRRAGEYEQQIASGVVTDSGTPVGERAPRSADQPR